jgi:hypothetical protein
MDGNRERCLACGMDDYIAKPVNLEDLGAVLDRWITPSSVDVVSLEDRSCDPEGDSSNLSA